ncbi:MAG TPA: sugar transferase [Clostridiales bacterium]|nr:sugar transferase [Clostridiales bacterium]
MYAKYIKRLLDIIFSLIALPFVCLVIIVMAPIIYIDNPGPVFYNAQRRGKNGKIFRMFKLRSMYVNSPNLKNADGSTFNSEKDPRVTRVGKFIRKLSIDEIPQLLNVLIGDMSVIGPRPTLATRPYEELSDLSKTRLAVRPGITGYAQAFYRNSITQEEKFRYDCQYIDRISFLLDLNILIQTILVVLGRKNIYSDEGSFKQTTK